MSVFTSIICSTCTSAMLNGDGICMNSGCRSNLPTKDPPPPVEAVAKDTLITPATTDFPDANTICHGCGKQFSSESEICPFCNAPHTSRPPSPSYVVDYRLKQVGGVPALQPRRIPVITETEGTPPPGDKGTGSTSH